MHSYNRACILCQAGIFNVETQVAGEQPERQICRVFSCCHMATWVAVQLPFWGGVSHLLPMPKASSSYPAMARDWATSPPALSMTAARQFPSAPRNRTGGIFGPLFPTFHRVTAAKISRHFCEDWATHLPAACLQRVLAAWSPRWRMRLSADAPDLRDHAGCDQVSAIRRETHTATRQQKLAPSARNPVVYQGCNPCPG